MYRDGVVLLRHGDALADVDVLRRHVLLEPGHEPRVLRDLHDVGLFSFICCEGLDALCNLR